MAEDFPFPIDVPALKITQPLGVFYAVKLSARLLLRVTYSDPLRIVGEAQLGRPYPLAGSQREQSLRKLQEIGRFIETVEAAFPNSIILGANYNDNGELEEADDRRWRVDELNPDGYSRLIIPSPARLAAIIDGQHRLHGFDHAGSNTDMELLCAVYLDLPNPYQAYIFATINFNQKRVDRSLAYELFGFDLDDEPPDSWAPDKTAVFLCRKLNTDEDSPLHQHIIVAAQHDEILFHSKSKEVDWAVSTATVVDGILSLYSSNPKSDRDTMHRKTIREGRSRSMLKDDGTPLRTLYLQTNDLAIYTAVKNFFGAAKRTLWSNASERSYIRKTVGIQALFEILRMLLKDFEQTRKISSQFFEDHLSKAAGIDFSEKFFQASGIGKIRIRRTIALKLGLIGENDLPEHEREDYLRLAGAE